MPWRTQLKPPEYRKDIGLYRDDGLAAFDKQPRAIENIKNNEHNLKITIEANKKCVNYLDVTFDLRTSSFKPYTKPGNTLQYVHRQSNHPPAVLKAIPDAINNRLSNISSDEQTFYSGVDKRRTDGGRRTADDGRRTTDGGRRTTDGGRRTADGGPRSIL